MQMAKGHVRITRILLLFQLRQGARAHVEDDGRRIIEGQQVAGGGILGGGDATGAA